MNILKNIFKTFLILFFIGIILAIVLFLIYIAIGPVLNDYRGLKLERELGEIDLPQDTEIFETNYSSGNLSRTRDNVEIWVGAIIYSTLSQNELENYFSEYDVFIPYPKDKDNLEKYMNFKNTKKLWDLENYYILGNYHKPFTKIDIRGY